MQKIAEMQYRPIDLIYFTKLIKIKPEIHVMHVGPQYFVIKKNNIYKTIFYLSLTCYKNIYCNTLCYNFTHKKEQL